MTLDYNTLANIFIISTYLLVIFFYFFNDKVTNLRQLTKVMYDVTFVTIAFFLWGIFGMLIFIFSMNLSVYFLIKIYKKYENKIHERIN